MKVIKFSTLLLFIIFFINCKNSNQDDSTIDESKLTTKVNNENTLDIKLDSVVVFLNPSIDEIKELKKQKGEDNFYTIADDENNYVANNIEILKNQNISIISTDKTQIKFDRDNIIFKKLTNENKWSILIYKKNNPLKVISSVDLFIELDENLKKKKKIIFDLLLNESKQNMNLSNEDDLSYKNPSEINGIWRVDCGNTLTTLEISNSNAYVSVYSNTLFINSKISISDQEPNTYYLKFLNQDEFSTIEDSKIDEKQMSKDKNIAKLIVENKKLKLYWFGLFNLKTNKVEFNKNTPFELESENQNPVILNKCE